MDLLEEEEEVVQPLPTRGPRVLSWLRRGFWPALGALASGGAAWLFAGVLVPDEGRPGPALDPGQASLAEVYDLKGFADAEMVQIPAIKVTLADENHDGLARIELYVEYRARDPERTREAIEAELAVRIRDALTMHISGKYASSLRTVTGKQLLKLELIDVLDGILFPGLREGKVTAIYYQEFMVS